MSRHRRWMNSVKRAFKTEAPERTTEVQQLDSNTYNLKPATDRTSDSETKASLHRSGLRCSGLVSMSSTGQHLVFYKSAVHYTTSRVSLNVSQFLCLFWTSVRPLSSCNGGVFLFETGPVGPVVSRFAVAACRYLSVTSVEEQKQITNKLMNNIFSSNHQRWHLCPAEEVKQPLLPALLFLPLSMTNRQRSTRNVSPGLQIRAEKWL